MKLIYTYYKEESGRIKMFNRIEQNRTSAKYVILNLFQDLTNERPCDPESHSASLAPTGAHTSQPQRFPLSSSGRRVRMAFTLAEVLITLGIIGVVAAMTIPTLMNKTQELEYKTGYKKAFSVASQAWMQAVTDGNIESRQTTTEAPSKINNFNAFKSYFKISKDCNASNNAECWASDGDKYWSLSPSSDALAFIDSSGVSWSLCSNAADTGYEILLDTNGLKKPNRYGQDRFIIHSVAANGATTGFPEKIIPKADCLDTASCTNYAGNCPSVATHSCYFQSWLIN